MDGVTLPTVSRRTLRIPNSAETASILTNADEDYRTPLLIAAATGMRRGEVCALRWSDVQLDGSHDGCSMAGVPHLHIEQTLQRVNGELTTTRPKTERGGRAVPLPDSPLRRSATTGRNRRPGAYCWARRGPTPISLSMAATDSPSTPMDSVRRSVGGSHGEHLRRAPPRPAPCLGYVDDRIGPECRPCLGSSRALAGRLYDDHLRAFGCGDGRATCRCNRGRPRCRPRAAVEASSHRTSLGAG
jgi:hypothetical protein